MNTKPNADHGTAAPQNADAQMIDLDPIKARANAATEGPWGVEDARVFGDDGRTQVCTLSGTRAWLPDAAFISHARTDIPALLAEVERLRGIVDRVREVHAPIDALNTRYNQVQKVCTGCGTDDGNWQNWPCPTIRALEGP